MENSFSLCWVHYLLREGGILGDYLKVLAKRRQAKNRIHDSSSESNLLLVCQNKNRFCIPAMKYYYCTLIKNTDRFKPVGKGLQKHLLPNTVSSTMLEQCKSGRLSGPIFLVSAHTNIRSDFSTLESSIRNQDSQSYCVYRSTNFLV